jgi:hypothetical protein
MVIDLWNRIEETKLDPKTHGNFVSDESGKPVDSEIIVLGELNT